MVVLLEAATKATVGSRDDCDRLIDKFSVDLGVEEAVRFRQINAGIK